MAEEGTYNADSQPSVTMNNTQILLGEIQDRLQKLIEGYDNCRDRLDDLGYPGQEDDQVETNLERLRHATNCYLLPVRMQTPENPNYMSLENIVQEILVSELEQAEIFKEIEQQEAIARDEDLLAVKEERKGKLYAAEPFLRLRRHRELAIRQNRHRKYIRGFEFPEILAVDEAFESCLQTGGYTGTSVWDIRSLWDLLGSMYVPG